MKSRGKSLGLPLGLLYRDRRVSGLRRRIEWRTPVRLNKELMKLAPGFIGPIRSFDFLRLRFSPDGLSVARQTVANFVEKASRLYEREWRTRSGRGSALEMYGKRWLAWVAGGLGGRPVDVRRGLGDHGVVDHRWRRIVQAGQATRATRAGM